MEKAAHGGGYTGCDITASDTKAVTVVVTAAVAAVAAIAITNVVASAGEGEKAPAIDHQGGSPRHAPRQRPHRTHRDRG